MPSLEEALGWVGYRVDDIRGSRVGHVSGIHVDVETGEPVWLVIKTRRLGPVTAVPIAHCATGGERVWCAHDRDTIQSGPEIEPGEQLTREQELGLCANYGIVKNLRGAEIRGHGHGTPTAMPGAQARAASTDSGAREQEPELARDLGDRAQRRRVWQLDWSAEHTLTRRQRIFLVASALVLLGAAVVDLAQTLTVITGFFALAFLATTALRLTYVYAGYRVARPWRLEEAPPPQTLRRYTVLVAIYREANVVPALFDSLERLTYPREKLEVLLLLEHDDAETLRACERELRPGWRIIVVPPGVPRTKPRALNVGLEEATGDWLTIYDAEDRPEPDQLLKAAAGFTRLPFRVAALQARLDFYNSHQNALTKWFTCEYATHFSLYLRGVSRFDHAIPLGGTSTHFRTQAIRDVGGWDAWNVTEDCELGMRLVCAGFRTRTLDSVTWEEAVPRVRDWIRQRSRWVKGFAQTGLVYLREPIKAGRLMGWRRYGAMIAIVPGVALTLCAQLVFWILFWTYIALRVSGANVEPIESVFPEPFLSLSVTSLLFGNFAMLLAFVAGVYERRRYDLMRWAVVVPLYWFLISLGAWRGVLQLWGRPHLWEKTTHGLTEPQPMPGVGAMGRVPEPEAGATLGASALAGDAHGSDGSRSRVDVPASKER